MSWYSNEQPTTIAKVEEHLKAAQQAETSIRGARATSGKSSETAPPAIGTGGTQQKGTYPTAPTQK